MGYPFSLYNTLTRSVQRFTPIAEGRVGLYACGMTVYDDCHVGHARAMVTFDMITRYLRHRGWEVTFVRNVTDIDDKIIQRARELGEDPLQLAQRFTSRFHRDMDALGLLRPTHEPRVSECVEDIIGLIERLLERGHAYVDSGCVWFDVSSFSAYGRLSGQRVANLRSLDSAPGKRASQDFALWKEAKVGEPSWESPWGPGRPGWHIECSAMVSKHFGARLDIHGGGLDLIFPHHENEIAQSECAHGASPFAAHWMHNGLLTTAGGQKMGKSLGNAIAIRDALARFPREALRIYYLQVHYRSPLPWSIEALPDALAFVARLYEAKEAALRMAGEEDCSKVAEDLGRDASLVLDLARAFPQRLYDAMDSDFNSAQALGYAMELARSVNRFASHPQAKRRGGTIAAEAVRAFELLADALGVLVGTPQDFEEEVKRKRLPEMGLTREAVEDRLRERATARDARDWAQADAIRAELENAGIKVMDSPEGVQWRVRL